MYINYNFIKKVFEKFDFLIKQKCDFLIKQKCDLFVIFSSEIPELVSLNRVT